MTLYEYIQEFSLAIAGRKQKKLRNLLTISPGPEIGVSRAQFQDPSDVDLYLFPEKFKPVLRAYLHVMRSVYVANDISKAFFDLLDLMVHFNRAAESQTNWVCLALINCSKELISVYQVRLSKHPETEGASEESSEGWGASEGSKNTLELVANTINRSFKICLTDKNTDMSELKKSSIHFFLAALIKIYFKLNRLELAKSMEKALVGTKLAIPTIVNSPLEYRKHIVTYLYFSALLSLDEGNFAFAEFKLLTAMDFLACYKKPEKVAKHAEKILFLLIPLKLYTSKAILPPEVWNKFPKLRYVYKEQLFDAIFTGNLRKFDECVDKFRSLFLKRHIFILVLQLKLLCQLRLVKRTATIYRELEDKTPHIIPFSGLELAMDLSKNNQQKASEIEFTRNTEAGSSYEELECILANLIANKQIKGYLSHSNKCIVTLKTEPFPA